MTATKMGAAQRRTRRAARISKTSISSRSPAGAGLPAQGQRRRLSRAEWHAEQEMSMSIAKAESAVLDSAAQKEKEAHKSLQAVQAQAELLAKEKRKALEAVEQANAAMREAKRLQAAATAKYEQAEALLAQYGLADVPPQPTPAPEASKEAPAGEFGL